MQGQTQSDRAGSFVAALVALRNAERARDVLPGTVLPLARQVMASSREAYSAGQISFVELIDSQRALLDVRQVIAEVRIEREKRLADLEALAGVDAETLSAFGGTTMPAPVPPAAATNIQIIWARYGRRCDRIRQRLYREPCCGLLSGSTL